MEIGASDAPASFGCSVWHSLACRRVGSGADEAVDQHGSEVRILRRIHAKIYEKTALRARRDVNAALGRRR